MLKSLFFSLFTMCLLIVDYTKSYKVLTHFLSLNDNMETFSEDQIFRVSLQQKIDAAETEEDIFVFVEEVNL